MVNVATSSDNEKTKGDDLHAGRLKNVPVDFKILSDLVNKVVKKAVYNNQNVKVNNLQNEIRDESTIIQTSQCNTGQHNLVKKN